MIRRFAQKQPNWQENRLFFVHVIHFLEKPRGFQFNSKKKEIAKQKGH
jgi:hypothetical protein